MARYKPRTKPFHVPISTHVTDREDSGVQLDEPSSPISKHFESSRSSGDMVKSACTERSNLASVIKSSSQSEKGHKQRRPQFTYEDDSGIATSPSREPDNSAYKSRTKGAGCSPLVTDCSQVATQREEGVKCQDVSVTFTLDEDEGLDIRDSNSSINKGHYSHTDYLQFNSDSSDENSDTEMSEHLDSIEVNEVSVDFCDISLKEGVQQSDSKHSNQKPKSSKDPKKKRFHRLIRKPAIKRSQSLGCEKDLVPEHALFLQYDPADIHSKESETPDKELNDAQRRTIYKTSSADAAMMAGEVLPLDTPELPKSKPISSIAKNVKRKLKKLHRRNTDSFLGAAIMSVRGPKVTQTEALEWGKTFESLLMDKNGLEMFKNFLKSEFSEENIEFWIACEDFKTTRTNKLVSRAQKIYSDFVAINAPRQINLDSKTRLETISNLENPTRDLYQQAQKRIQFLMENDSYKRFLETDIYKNLIGHSSASGS